MKSKSLFKGKPIPTEFCVCECIVYFCVNVKTKSHLQDVFGGPPPLVHLTWLPVQFRKVHQPLFHLTIHNGSLATIVTKTWVLLMFTSPKQFKMPDETIMAKPWILSNCPPPPTTYNYKSWIELNILTFVIPLQPLCCIAYKGIVTSSQ